MGEVKITEVATTMQKILGRVAQAAGFATGLIVRMRTMTAEAFVQGVVLTWLQNPNATLEQLAQGVTAAGSPLSAQSLDERFTPAAAKFLREVLNSAAMQMLAADPSVLPILRRFKGVNLHDSTTIALPKELVEYWRGCGGSLGENAAVKLQVRLDLLTGTMVGPVLEDGRSQDKASSLYQEALPAGSLEINDLGYFSLSVFQEQQDRGVLWLSRLLCSTAVFDEQGNRLDLPSYLAHQTDSTVELSVKLGLKEMLGARLLAVRVPPDVAAERRRKLHYQAGRKQRAVSPRRLILCDWTILITNVPQAQLQAKEAVTLYRARWQIELLFRFWKKYAKVATSRSRKPIKQLCELYAKLLGVLLQHWLLLVGCWGLRNRSLEKAAQAIQGYGKALLLALGSRKQLCKVISSIVQCLQKGCRINKSLKTPRTWQILLALEADTKTEASHE